MTLPEEGRLQAETLLRRGLSDEQVRRHTGASSLEILELRAEAAVRLALECFRPTTVPRPRPYGRPSQSPGGGGWS